MNIVLEFFFFFPALGQQLFDHDTINLSTAHLDPLDPGRNPGTGGRPAEPWWLPCGGRGGIADRQPSVFHKVLAYHDRALIVPGSTALGQDVLKQRVRGPPIGRRSRSM